MALAGNSMNLELGANTVPGITGYEVFYGSARRPIMPFYPMCLSVATNLVIPLLPGARGYLFISIAQPLNGGGAIRQDYLVKSPMRHRLRL